MSYIYEKGSMPLIVISLHGGRQNLDCKKRTNLMDGKEYVINNDAYTKQITLKTYDQLIKLGMKPYLLVNDIQRKYVDLNRYMEHACNHYCEGCIMQYVVFHDKLLKTVMQIIKKYGKCFIFDIHGNKNSGNMVQFGYNLTTKQIRNKELETFSYNSTRNTTKSNIEKFIYKDKSLSYYFKDLFDNVYPTYGKLDNSYIVNNNYKYYSGK